MSLPQNEWLQLHLHSRRMQTGHGQGPVPFISFLPKVVRSKRDWCSGQSPWLSSTWPRDSEWEVLAVCMSTMKARQKWVLGDSGNGFCFHLSLPSQLVIFFQRALKEYYDHSLFSTCTESSEHFLRNDSDCKAIEGLDIFEKLLWL